MSGFNNKRNSDSINGYVDFRNDPDLKEIVKTKRHANDDISYYIFYRRAGRDITEILNDGLKRNIIIQNIFG
ncbi:hypothetical protein PghCCS26_24660 [Paenibacillus glycanilyticus]|uniref:Uncharacterized protein n=1 Tax=Paenibacillus glycanilyticus TaxID=126569 RepID=A0ABQ6NLA8_9BACL|nr:hypothetical protein PghCCS26_24660 [Paenibacillus glycanilyticus]